MFKIFSRHYGTERFFIMIFLCFSLLLSLTVYSGVVQHERNRRTLSTTAVYTRSYKWSRTSGTGSVIGMYTDSRNQSIFLLLQNNEATSFSANDYQVFLTGRDEKLVNSPVLTVFSYGPTGYVGFYLRDARGFNNQVYSMIIRNDSAASEYANENTFDPNAERDVSFRDHNQIRLYLNFGAEGVEKMAVLDSPNVTPLQMLMDMSLNIASENSFAMHYKSACSSAQSDLAAMSQDLLDIAQLRANLQDNSVVVPDLPYYIVGDRVDTVPSNFSEAPMSFTSEMISDAPVDGFGSGYLGGAQPDADSGTDSAPAGTSGTGGVAGQGASYTDSEGKEHLYYYLHTDYLYPGTVHFDWEGQPLSTGFVTKLAAFNTGSVSADTAYRNYTEWRDSMKEDYSGSMPASVRYSGWRYTTGGYLDMSKASLSENTGTDGLVPTMALKYEAAVNSYLQHKQAYLSRLDAMLAAENEVQALGTVMTANDGRSLQNLWIY